MAHANLRSVVCALPVVFIATCVATLLSTSVGCFKSPDRGGALVILNYNEELAGYSGQRGRMLAVAWAADGKNAISASHDGSIRVWTMAGDRKWSAGPAIRSEDSGERKLTCMSLSPNGRWVAVGFADGAIDVMDARNGGRAFALAPQRSITTVAVTAVAFNPTPAAFDPSNKIAFHLASGESDGVVRVWRLDFAAKSAAAASDVSVAAAGPVLGIAIAPAAGVANDTQASGASDPSADSADTQAEPPTGKIAVACSGGTVQLWKWRAPASAAAADDPIRELEEDYLWSGLHAPAARGVAFSPTDPRRLASVGSDGQLFLIDTDSHSAVPAATGLGALRCVAFSNDGRRIAAGSQSGPVWFWTIDRQGRTGSETSREGHDGVVYSVAFSPDAKQFISGGADETARIWNAPK